MSFKDNGHGRNWVRHNDEPWRDWNHWVLKGNICLLLLIATWDSHPCLIPTLRSFPYPHWARFSFYYSYMCIKGWFWTGPCLGTELVHSVWLTTGQSPAAWQDCTQQRGETQEGISREVRDQVWSAEFKRWRWVMKDRKDSSLSLSFLRGMKLQFCALVSVFVNFEEKVFTFISWKFTQTRKNKNEIHL